MIPCLETHPEVAVLGVVLCLFGGVLIARGLQFRFARIPYFVVGYRGWSNPPLTLPFAGMYFAALGVGMFREDFPGWFGDPFAFFFLFSLLVSLLGFFVWFPWFLLPGWYRRARKAGVPRHDPYAMARFKRLSRAEQREVTWADLFDGSEGEVCVGVRESLSVPRSPVGGAAVGLVVGLGVGAAIPVEVEGKSLGDRVADAGGGVWNAGKDLWKKVFR